MCCLCCKAEWMPGRKVVRDYCWVRENVMQTFKLGEKQDFHLAAKIP